MKHENIRWMVWVAAVAHRSRLEVISAVSLFSLFSLISLTSRRDYCGCSESVNNKGLDALRNPSAETLGKMSISHRKKL